jgi:hypothetical protein
MRPIVAQFVVRVLEQRRALYPYWLLGWNFTNGPEHNEPKLINNQQFLFAMSRLGFNIPVPASAQMDQWEDHYMASVDGYRALDEALHKIDHCEPCNPRFKHAPRLCRKWWDSAHTGVCG